MGCHSRDELQIIHRLQTGRVPAPAITDLALGEREKGLEWARRARAIAPEQPMLLYNLGCIYSLAGEIDEALDCLERAVTHGFLHKEWFEHDSNLDLLRSHPRFLAIMEKLG
jgi:adenylate cyclase